MQGSGLGGEVLHPSQQIALLQEHCPTLVEQLPGESDGTSIVSLSRIFVGNEVKGLRIEDEPVGVMPLGRDRAE